MTWAIGDTFYFEFSTRNTSGALSDASSGPSGTLVVNGSDQATTVTIPSSVSTGRYKGSVSLSGRSLGDIFYVRVTATVDGVSDEFVVEGGRISLDANGVVLANDRNGNAIMAALNSGTAQAGTGTTITLAATASDQNNAYRDNTIKLTGGTGAGQARLITAYQGSSREATVDQAWIGQNPDATTTYEVTGGVARLARIEHDEAIVPANVTQIDGTAAPETDGKLHVLDGDGEAIAKASEMAEVLEDTSTTLPDLIDDDNTGTGARTVTVTIDDGSDPLENAVVRMTEGANTYNASTNASGTATFNLNDATYTVAVTKAGYSFSGTTLVVDGDETITYSMSQIVTSSPTLPDGCVCSIYVYDTNGVAVSGQTIDFRVRTLPENTDGLAYQGSWTTSDASAANGLIEIELTQGAVYEMKWTVNSKITNRVFTVPSEDAFTLPSIISPV